MSNTIDVYMFVSHKVETNKKVMIQEFYHAIYKDKQQIKISITNGRRKWGKIFMLLVGSL